jgi:hypothetical protein
MEDQQSLRSFKTLIKKVPQLHEILEFLNAVAKHRHKGADYTAVIVGRSLLDNVLEDFILAHLRQNLTPKQKGELFGIFKPLSTFAAKINVAYAIKILPEPLHRDLEAIKEIRNLFAHAKTLYDFDTPEVAAACRKLITGTRPGVGNYLPRTLYINAVKKLWALLRLRIGGPSIPADQLALYRRAMSAWHPTYKDKPA